MSEKKIFISDIKIKDQVKTTFMLKLFHLMEGRDGRPYLNVILTDATGDLESRMWGEEVVKLSHNLKTGNIVQVKGKMNIYQGKKQFIIQEISSLENLVVDNDLYYPKSRGDADKIYQALVAMVEELDDFYIKKLLLSILGDESLVPLIKSSAAAKTIHHAYQGGLLEHIHSCCKLALLLSDFYSVNRNYVLAGAILHDLCKVHEMTLGPLVEYTDEGKLVGHLVKSIELVELYSKEIPHFPEDLKIHLKHILLSHHGELAFGSPKVPQTKEAYLVHLIDLMDSKMGSFDLIIRNDQTPGHWSQYIKHLDRIIYKSELPFYPEQIAR